jgi:hypothetical protein
MKREVNPFLFILTLLFQKEVERIKAICMRDLVVTMHMEKRLTTEVAIHLASQEELSTWKTK